MMTTDNYSVVEGSTTAMTSSSSRNSLGLDRSNNIQMKKRWDANGKYKNLLKMAMERIQAQEEELDKLRDELAEEKKKVMFTPSKSLSRKLVSWRESVLNSFEYDVPVTTIQRGEGEDAPSITRVFRSLRVETDRDDSDASHHQNDDVHTNCVDLDGHIFSPLVLDDNNNMNKDRYEEIWALIEYKRSDPLSYTPNVITADPAVLFSSPEMGRFRRWRRFTSDAALYDHVRRESGEPIVVPPYSLSAEQSERIQKQAHETVAHISDEFRRFRVRSEVARKQTDASFQALQNSKVRCARKLIENQDLTRENHLKVNSIRVEITQQETHWKEAYDLLMAENESLRSARGETLLASQWRKRYEKCLSGKENLEVVFSMEKQKLDKTMNRNCKEDKVNYEAKYKDLKESFRLYRKKAKEIFEAQQQGDVAMMTINNMGAEDAKIAYLKNLFVNYLSSNLVVREHIESAIGTVLKFSADDKDKIDKQKQQNDSWFHFT